MPDKRDKSHHCNKCGAKSHSQKSKNDGVCSKHMQVCPNHKNWVYYKNEDCIRCKMEKNIKAGEEKKEKAKQEKKDADEKSNGWAKDDSKVRTKPKWEKKQDEQDEQDEPDRPDEPDEQDE